MSFAIGVLVYEQMYNGSRKYLNIYRTKFLCIDTVVTKISTFSYLSMKFVFLGFTHSVVYSMRSL